MLITGRLENLENGCDTLVTFAGKVMPGTYLMNTTLVPGGGPTPTDEP